MSINLKKLFLYSLTFLFSFFSIVLQTIIMIGKAVLDIVKDNKPVVNVATDLASAIPQGASWTAMAGWKGPKNWGPFTWSRLNGFNTETVHVRDI
jgi:hypothetical protein